MLGRGTTTPALVLSAFLDIMTLRVSYVEASIRIGGIRMRSIGGRFNGMGAFLEGGMIYDEP